MGAVHIGIGHNDNLIISQLLDVKIFMNSRSKSGNHCAYLGISIDSVKSGFFYVQNLSSQRKDCLVRFIPGLFCRTSGGISLNDINFTVFRILI